VKFKFTVVKSGDHQAAFIYLSDAIEWVELQWKRSDLETWVIHEHDGKGRYRVISKFERPSA
jgi:hypothetical protein